MGYKSHPELVGRNSALLRRVSPKTSSAPAFAQAVPCLRRASCPASSSISLHAAPVPSPWSSAWACGPRADLANGDPTQLLHFPRGVSGVFFFFFFNKLCSLGSSSPDQELNPSSLDLDAQSLTTDHQGSPRCHYFLGQLFTVSEH